MMDEQTLAAWAKALGFAKATLCPADRFDAAQRLVSEQEPLRERRQLRFDPAADDPRVKSLAVLLWPYAPAASVSEKSLFVDSYYYASSAAYHTAKSLEARLTEIGCYARANVSYPAKEAAVRAGLGIIGQNSLLITPEYGTRVVIILMATDIELCAKERRPESRPSHCLNCGRCVAACPSGAITAQGMEHPERCLRNYIMEGVVVPEALRSKIGMRLIGCDICQRVCPMQPNAASDDAPAFSLADFVTDDDARFGAAAARLAGQIGRNAARPQRIRAQAALLAGNSKNPAYLPTLNAWAQSPFEAVAEHARWAIARIDRPDGGT